jgi:hypothetical protein
VAQVLFYDRPVALNRQSHQGLKIKGGDPDFRFACQTNSVPLAGVEFARAALEYPIVFAGAAPDKLMPVAVVGLRDNENLFVDAAGHWVGSYIPAFVRRYPFVLAQQGSGADFTVCIDDAYAGFGQDGGQALFDAEGKESPFLQNALNFLREYQDHIRYTQVFASRLAELNLLEAMAMRVTGVGDRALVLQGFQAVNEKWLGQLTDPELCSLYRQGFLGWIHAHLISLGNVPRLQERLKGRAGEQESRKAGRQEIRG